jgi:peroxiredoxin family protein
MQIPTVIFFTFWGLTSLKRKTVYSGKRPLDRLIGAMLPSGGRALRTSTFNVLGLGARFLSHLVRRHHGQTLCELIRLARELGVRFVACQAAMEMMGITCEELMEGVECAAAATALDAALESRITLFI